MKKDIENMIEKSKKIEKIISFICVLNTKNDITKRCENIFERM